MSRGLGDVYKRQIQDLCMDSWGDTRFSVDKLREERGKCGGRSDRGGPQGTAEKLLGDREALEAPGGIRRHHRGIRRHSEALGDTREASGGTSEKEWNNLEERGIIRKRISCHQPSAGDKT